MSMTILSRNEAVQFAKNLGLTLNETNGQLVFWDYQRMEKELNNQANTRYLFVGELQWNAAYFDQAASLLYSEFAIESICTTVGGWRQTGHLFFRNGVEAGKTTQQNKLFTVFNQINIIEDGNKLGIVTFPGSLQNFMLYMWLWNLSHLEEEKIENLFSFTGWVFTMNELTNDF